MKSHLFVLGSDQMVDDVAAGGVPPAITEPFLAQVAHNHAIRLVDPAIFACVIGQLLAVIKFLIVFFELELAKALCCCG